MTENYWLDYPQYSSDNFNSYQFQKSWISNTWDALGSYSNSFVSDVRGLEDKALQAQLPELDYEKFDKIPQYEIPWYETARINIGKGITWLGSQAEKLIDSVFDSRVTYAQKEAQTDTQKEKEKDTSLTKMLTPNTLLIIGVIIFAIILIKKKRGK